MNWHQVSHLNECYNIGVKIYFIPLCCFSPFCPLSWVLGGLADNRHKSSDLGEKWLVNIEWTVLILGLNLKPIWLLPELSLTILWIRGRKGTTMWWYEPLKNYDPFWNSNTTILAEFCNSSPNKACPWVSARLSSRLCCSLAAAVASSVLLDRGRHGSQHWLNVGWRGDKLYHMLARNDGLTSDNYLCCLLLSDSQET